MEAPDTLPEQQKLVAKICAELGQRCVDSRDYDKAIRSYKEAANHDDSDGKVEPVTENSWRSVINTCCFNAFWVVAKDRLEAL